MSQRANIEEAENLVLSALDSPDAFVAKGLGNDLLIQFFRGYPIENLQKLLDHEDERIVRTGLWIASELPGRIQPIFDKIISFAGNRDFRFRYIILDIIACQHNPRLFCYVLDSMDDSEPVVQRKALDIMIHASKDKINDIYCHVCAYNGSSVHKIYLGLLISNTTYDTIKNLLSDDNPIAQKYGLIAAARSYGRSSDLIKIAVNSKNPSVVAEGNFLLRASGNQSPGRGAVGAHAVGGDRRQGDRK